MNQISMNHADTRGAARPAPATIAPTVAHLFILFSALLVAGIALELGHIFYLQIITFHPLPYLDEWRTMILFSRVEQDLGSWSLLLVPHAEHRPFLPRLVFLLDTKLAHGTGALSLAAIDCLLLGLVSIWSILLIGNAGRNERVQLAAPYVLALCIASLLFSGHQMSNFVRGFQTTMLMFYFFTMLSFAALASALRRAASVRPARSLLLISFACFFGVCAAFSIGNGIIVLMIPFYHGLRPTTRASRRDDPDHRDCHCRDDWGLSQCSRQHLRRS